MMELQTSNSGGGTTEPRTETQTADFSESSCVSMQGNKSKDYPIYFRDGPKSSHQRTETQTADSPESSCVSMQSNKSKDYPIYFSDGPKSSHQRFQFQTADSPVSSCVSRKSDKSIEHPPYFSDGPKSFDQRTETQTADSPESSCVSMQSNKSKDYPIYFSDGSKSSHQGTETQTADSPESSCVSLKTHKSKECSVYFSDGPKPSDQGKLLTETALHENILDMGTTDLQQESSQPIDEVLNRASEKQKTSMKNKYENLFEGFKSPENRTLLNRIYTKLSIIEGESEGVNKEHEVLQMENTQRKQVSPINCLDIFKPLQAPKQGTKEVNIGGAMAKNVKHTERKEDKDPNVQKIRTVLTKGIAGIGKTVSVQKFILDWAEGKANQDVDFMFVLPFRELNLIKDDQFSLHQLLCVFHPELRDLDPKIYDVCRAVFIFDGLDESKIPHKFGKCEKVSDVSMTSSVSDLMMNLIIGDLLSSAHIWITSRPAAANQIPHQFINRVTEIQGFSDPQKEEYFRKRIRDQNQAQKIISHIKTARSLHIMCHIPVFCWISATVLQRIINQHHTEIPKTLTEMYAHFLLTQINTKKEKYKEEHERDPQKLLESNRTELLKLAELAFKQLMKGNVMFYEEDLRESGIDITEASVHSGIFTEIFKEECVIYQRKVYCFVHLSFQEFLAALYVLHCYQNKNMAELEMFNPRRRELFKSVKLEELLCGAVDKAVRSENGHLDLFLRFLLGISLEINQKILHGLLLPTRSNLETTTEYIKNLIKGDNKYLSTERSINLFLCLYEMNDQSISREIQKYLKSENHSEVKLYPGHCSALAYMILISEEVLDELDLKKYNTSGEGYRRLVAAVSVCRKALLADSYLTVGSCQIISSALQSVNSYLKELDVSNNDLQDLGVELISDGLRSSHCKLEILRLASCGIGEKTCGTLGSILQSENSSLKDLDLSNNDLQDSSVELLSAALKSSHCKLKSLRLSLCNLKRKTCTFLGSVLQSAHSSLKDLDLSNNDLQDSGVELLSAALSSHCKLETLRLSGCMVTEEGCSSLTSALKLNPTHLRELDLTYNNPGESGVKLLSGLLEDPHYKLNTLRMEHGAKIRMKPGLKKYACDITLDPNTAHTRLSLSEAKRKVDGVREDQPYPDHPERFKDYEQVLSSESLTGRCYWEAEWSGSGCEAVIAVSYRRISKTGEESRFGENKQSWRLLCTDYNGNIRYSVRHNSLDQSVRAPPPPRSHRVGVYLNYPAGTLSFYRVSPDTHTLTHLYTFRTTFTEPLNAGFWVYIDSSVSVCVC